MSRCLLRPQEVHTQKKAGIPEVQTFILSSHDFLLEAFKRQLSLLFTDYLKNTAISLGDLFHLVPKIFGQKKNIIL